jgi:hypothetical protein
MKRLVNTARKNYDATRGYIQNPLFAQKPTGLWYSVGNEWMVWCKDNISDWLEENVWELNVVVSQILVIKSFEDLKRFQETYESHCEDNQFSYIDWNAVSRDYSGIEIRNYKEITEAFMLEDYFDLNWVTAFSCSSGCIWNLEAIRSVKRREICMDDVRDPNKKKEEPPKKEQLALPYEAGNWDGYE